jgi:hypothetical protein
MVFSSFLGKTVVAVAVDDEGTSVQFMFSDGTAVALNTTIIGTYLNGRGGLRSIEGVTSFLNHPITVVTFPNNADPNAVFDRYEGFGYEEVHLGTSSGTLIIQWLMNPSVQSYTMTGCSPTSDGVLTGDYTAPTPYSNEWN